MVDNKMIFKDIEKLPIDFEEIMEVMKKRIQSRLPSRWTDFLASNFGMEILEAVSYEAALMNYYLNSSINECFLPTAKTQSAVYNLAKTIGYKPRPSSQSIVILKFYIDELYSKPIFIPKYTIVSTESGLKFYTIVDSYIQPGELYVETIAKSGSLMTDSIISTGIPRYRYKLRKGTVNFIEEVKVNDMIYEQVEFIDQNLKEPFYMLEYDNEFNAYISFGDNVYGLNPPKNEIIEILYVTSAGLQDNIMPYEIVNVDSLIYDTSNSIIYIKVVNEKNAVGGAGPETLDEIKRNAPSIYRTQERCVTRQDFRDYIIAQPGIAKVSVMDRYILDEIAIFGVKVAVIPSNGGYPNSALKKEMLRLLEEKKIISTQVDIVDPSYIPFDVSMTLQVQPNISSNIISNTIRNKVYSYLSWQNRDFGDPVSKLEMQKMILETDGVLSLHNLTVTESKKVFVKEIIFEENKDYSNRIIVNDSWNILKEGSQINILSLSDELVLNAVIVEKDNNALILSNYITDDMNIGIGSLVYPIQRLHGDHLYGTKEITLKHEHIDGTEDFDFMFEMIDAVLINMSYATIYFSDNPLEKYQILFRNGNKLYLDHALDRDLKDGTEMHLLFKRNIPSLSAVAPLGTSVLKFENYPRFSKGSTLIRRDLITFENKTLHMYKSSQQNDYLSVLIDTDYLVKIDRIYINNNTVFQKNIDYNLYDNDKIITWTELGRKKIPHNTKFYIDVVRKKIPKGISDITYYVKSISGKYVTISPTLNTRLFENTIFDYVTDSFNLLPFEIADVGKIEINIV